MPKPTIPVFVLGILTTLAGLVWDKPLPGKCDLYGRIQFVQAFPDVKVQIVNAFPDIKVQKVTDYQVSLTHWRLPDVKHVDYLYKLKNGLNLLGETGTISPKLNRSEEHLPGFVQQSIKLFHHMKLTILILLLKN